MNCGAATVWNDGRYMALISPSQRLCEMVQPRVRAGRSAAAHGTQDAKNVLHSNAAHFNGSVTRSNSTNGPAAVDDRPKTIVSPHQSSSLSIDTNDAPVQTIWVACAIRPAVGTIGAASAGSPCHMDPFQYSGAARSCPRGTRPTVTRVAHGSWAAMPSTSPNPNWR